MKLVFRILIICFYRSFCTKISIITSFTLYQHLLVAAPLEAFPISVQFQQIFNIKEGFKNEQLIIYGKLVNFLGIFLVCEKTCKKLDYAMQSTYIQIFILQCKMAKNLPLTKMLTIVKRTVQLFTNFYGASYDRPIVEMYTYNYLPPFFNDIFRLLQNYFLLLGCVNITHTIG